MRFRFIATLALAGLSFAAWSAESGLVTAARGKLLLQEAGQPPVELKPFVKVRPQDNIVMDAGASLQLVYFDGGRQESWRGRGTLTVGETASTVGKGNPQGEFATLPAVLVKQLAKTPADGGVRSGMIRMRSLPQVTVASAEQRYDELRAAAAAGDRTPELYLLAAYFELREFDKAEALLARLADVAPGDAEIRALRALYGRAIADARTASR